jgi:hypothetical protein
MIADQLISFFLPEQIDAMHAAFTVVCARMRIRAGTVESDRIALKIVDLAIAGERNTERLASLAFADVDHHGRVA